MKLKIPGNILILGEYAVTEEGGIGLACAVDAFVEIIIKPSRNLTITSSYGGITISWKPGDHESPLISTIYKVCYEYLHLNEIKKAITGDISIDTSAFYTDIGAKKGLGSSAAVTCGLVHAFLWPVVGKERHFSDTVFDLSLKAHRLFQGGRGSGYDVAASFYGNTILFKGGMSPACAGLELDWLNDLYLFNGDKSQSTVSALTKYNNWKESHRQEAKNHFNLSNKLISDFIRASSLYDSAPFFRAIRKLNQWLGKEIHVPADGKNISGYISYLSKFGIAKCVGAGSELGVLITEKNLKLEGSKIQLSHYSISKEGLTCRD